MITYPRERLLLRGLAAAALASMLWLPASAAAAVYSFIRVADTSGPYSSFSFTSTPTISNAGAAAFIANLDAGGSGVFVGSGGAVTTIADTSGIWSLFDRHDINASGTVVFTALRDAGGMGLYFGSGGAVTTVVDSTGPLNSMLGPAINDAGNMSFHGSPDTGGTIVYRVSPTGVLTPIASDAGGLLSGFNASAINNVDQVAVGSLASTSAFKVNRGSGGPLTLIADASGLLSDLGAQVGVSLSDSGVAAFRAVLDSGENGIFSGSGGPLTMLADSTGPFGILSDPSINSSGLVAFAGRFDDGSTGLFTGPDPVLDKVIARFDPLDGSTVTGLAFSRFGLNDAGQMAFLATLADGRTGVYIATPAATPSGQVPEPNSLAILAGSLIGLIGYGRRWARRSNASSQ